MYNYLKMWKTKLIIFSACVLGGILISAVVVKAWTNPSAAPPGGSPGPIPVANGGTAATTTGAARTNLGAAASGANSDITSLTGLTTALGVAYGGTGGTTGSITGTGALTFTAGGTNQNINLTPSGTGIVAVTSGGVSYGSNSASTGAIRLPNATYVYARNALNTADHQLFGLDGSNVLQISNTSINTVISGSVGIGVSPSYKLDVVSGGATTARFGTAGTDTVIVGGGSGKLDTGTVDPIFEINGSKYATYLPGMTGIKEETSGVVVLDVSHKYILDFSRAEVGSDAWLFYHATDFGKDWGNLAVLLSAGFDGQVWYVKEPVSGRLILYGSEAGEVSFRLTAPRFDHVSWPNVYTGEATQGLTVPEK